MKTVNNNSIHIGTRILRFGDEIKPRRNTKM